MTENVFRAVYFLLRHDLPINLFEALIELLDNCNTLIGNQLHAITTARKMAMSIDELFQSAFVRFSISDKVDEFSQIGDELTDVGSIKMLLTKLRFFEKEWDHQENIFSIFESSGTSEQMADDFVEDFISQFRVCSSLSRGEVMQILSRKVISVGSDRGSKISKFSKFLKNKLPNYIHFKCENHVTETSWEEIQKVRSVEMVEETIRSCYGLLKNSASRQLKMTAIAKEFEEKSLKLKGLFDVKFLTSEQSANEALLVDYLQLLQLIENLQSDRNLKRERKETIKKLNAKLRDARVLCNAVALDSAVQEGIAPYILWSQKLEACAFEREFQKKRLYSKMEVLKQATLLPEEQKQFLESINYETKLF